MLFKLTKYRAVNGVESEEAAGTFRVPQPQPGKTTSITSLTKETVHLVLFGGILPSIPLRIKCAACKQIVRPVLEYSSGSWESLTKTQKNEFEAVQSRAAKLIYNFNCTTKKTTTNLLLQLDKLSDRRSHSRLKLFGQYHFNDEETIRNYLQRTCLAPSWKHTTQYQIPHSNTQHHQRSFFIKTAKEWNQLPVNSVYRTLPDVT